VSSGFWQLIVLMGLLQGASVGGDSVRFLRPLPVARPASTSLPRQWRIHPIKKRVGRAVNPTMDRIDNVWFVVSQIVVPLAAIIFSVVYVRRHRARQAAQSGCSADLAVQPPDEGVEE
jgi:hypothetical protein